MVYTWCTDCQSRVCANESSHRAQRAHQYRADFMVGGRYGKRIRKLFPNKKDAESFEYVTQADFKRGTFLPADKSKILFRDVLEKYYKEQLVPHSRRPEHSSKYFIAQLDKLLGHRPVGAITLKELEAKREEFQKDRGISNASVNRVFNTAITALNRAVEWGYISKNPAQFLRALPIEEPMPRFLTEEEIQRLRYAAKDDRLIKRINALLHTGIRPIDLDGLTWAQIDLKNRVIHVTTHKGRVPHRYAVPIDDVMLSDLKERFEKTKGQGLVYDSSNLRKLTAAAIKESKINAGRPQNERFTIYGLKHCYASHLLMNGASLFDVAELLGHTDTKMLLKHYGHLTQEHLRAVQSKINLTPALDRSSQLQVI